MWGSYCQKNYTGRSQIPKKSSSTYWKKTSFKTKTRKRYRRPAGRKTKFSISEETRRKERKKAKE